VEHVVFFPGPDGTPAFRRLASLEEAARFVEHLRNVENVSEAAVHSLTEVPLAFKTWYRVELPSTENGGQADAPVQPDPAAPAFFATADAGDAADVAGAAGPSSASVAAPEVPAPTTIAEAMQSYGYQAPSVSPSTVVELPDPVGSSTAIVVPFAEQTGSNDQPQNQPGSEQAGYGEQGRYGEQPRPAQLDEQSSQAQVLEPAFGARRDRGMGFFAR
jgi:hypothetical protein